MKKGIYDSLPWNSVDEYFELGMKYKCWGLELKKEVLKHIIPEPKVKKKIHRAVKKGVSQYLETFKELAKE